MAPPPEYDKEPKAPDKCITNISNDDSKVLYNHVKDQATNADCKSTNTSGSADGENNKHVETLDDGQLRALLDEAITYKCPKDREGKSSLFKELLEEVEQDEQACEAAARVGAGRGRRARGRHEHHSSLQDLVAAMAAEPAPRRTRHSHQPVPSAGTVAARAHHGGSLPSGVDTSFLLSEEPTRGAYLATVRCVNPPPLAERRVSASDANPPVELDLITRRSKPLYPMTYTARATLEIGSGSVCSGRAVTTTTQSNQVRTPAGPPRTRLPHSPPDPPRRLPTCGPPERSYKKQLYDPHQKKTNQKKLMDALCIQTSEAQDFEKAVEREVTIDSNLIEGASSSSFQCVDSDKSDKKFNVHRKSNFCTSSDDTDLFWTQSVNNWYESLPRYCYPSSSINQIESSANINQRQKMQVPKEMQNKRLFAENLVAMEKSEPVYKHARLQNYRGKKIIKQDYGFSKITFINDCNKIVPPKSNSLKKSYVNCTDNSFEHESQKEYRKKVGNNLIASNLSMANPKNIRSLTIGKPIQVHQGSLNKDQPSKKSVSKNSKAKMPTNNTKYEASSIFDSLTNEYQADTSNCTTTNSKTTDTKCITLGSTIGTATQEIENKLQCHDRDTADMELVDIQSVEKSEDNPKSFIQFVTDQERLFKKLKVDSSSEQSQNEVNSNDASTFDKSICSKELESQSKHIEMNNIGQHVIELNIEVVKKQSENENTDEKLVLTKLSNNTYFFVNLPKLFLTTDFRNNHSDKLKAIDENIEPVTINKNKNSKSKVIKLHNKEESKRKNALKVLLFSDNRDRSESGKGEVPSGNDQEVDSAIPFSCITTPEVVTSCNTTSSTVQTAVAVDPKPRNMLPSSFNGLSLSRPNYGSTATSVTDEYKKSLDENGNAVQEFSSPPSGSSQPKKSRRKKSSKNETVIKSHQIDGYQGNKDLNEVLRFIESNADGARAHKLGRKHKDDSDDKGGKKRSSERRKDKEKLKRASSLEELSRTKLEDLTDKPRWPGAPKAERRSWGDERATPYAEPEPAPELTDFQTVTKRRKPRRRADEREPGPRRARAPSPGPRAPPSDRSNDSTDDLDCAHSPPPAPAPPPPPPPHVSYADIARTRHNIPDLIESCNYYGEGESEPSVGGGGAGAEQYPALEAAARARDKAAAGVRARKERGEAPAPDVVAGGEARPAVVLRAAGRARELVGVTFGFDVNEQLLGAAVRYAPPPPPPHTHQLAHLHQIVDFVGTAWEDVVRCGTGKVRYYSE